MNQFILPCLLIFSILYRITMNNSIVRWNCRGFRANFEELSFLTKEYKPVAICLQETFLRETDRCSFKNYSCYYTSSGNAERA